MRISMVTKEDRQLTKVSAAIAEAIESGQGVTLRKVGSPRPSAPVSPVSDTLQNLIFERDRLKLSIDTNGKNPVFDTAAAMRRFQELQQLIMLRQQEPRRTDRGGRL